jgi:hypothetical protein
MQITMTAADDKFIFLSNDIKLAPADILTIDADEISLGVLATIRDNYLLKNLTLSLDDYSIVLTRIIEESSGVNGYFDKPNGVPQLDNTKLIRSQYLPSYIDDIIEFDSILDFPISGDLDKIYVDSNSQLAYRYQGTTYYPLGKGGSSDDLVEGATNLFYTQARKNDLVHSVNGSKGNVNTATVAQGAKADTAVQPNQLATIATTGSYSNLNNVPGYVNQLGLLSMAPNKVLETNSSNNLVLTDKIAHYVTQSYTTASPYTNGLVAISPDNTTLANSSLLFTLNGTGGFGIALNSLVGNQRGYNAIDLQLGRLDATQVASGSYSIAIGATNKASAGYATAIGYGNTVTVTEGYAFGYQNIVSGTQAIAVGRSSTASGSGSAAFGNGARATGVNSVAVGGSTSSGTSSVSLGGGTASGQGALVCGNVSTTASGIYAIGLGFQAIASGKYSFAVGYNCRATGDYSVALGYAADARNIRNYVVFGSGTSWNQRGNVSLSVFIPAGTAGRSITMLTTGVNNGSAGDELTVSSVLAATGTAIMTDDVDVKWWTFKFCAKPSSFITTPSIIAEGSTNNTNTSSWGLDISIAGSTLRFSAITGTTQARITANLNITDMIAL